MNPYENYLLSLSPDEISAEELLRPENFEALLFSDNVTFWILFPGIVREVKEKTSIFFDYFKMVLSENRIHHLKDYQLAELKQILEDLSFEIGNEISNFDRKWIRETIETITRIEMAREGEN